jgi:hypothetical protein
MIILFAAFLQTGFLTLPVKISLYHEENYFAENTTVV